MIAFLNAFLANDLKTPAIIFTLFVSFILSGVIGLEREYREQIAGLRTHILICLGSTIFTLMSRYIVLLYPSADASRIPAGIVSGIGFIAAGAIIKLGFTVKGVTTISSIWSVAALGIAVGMGKYNIAIVATVFILITLTIIGTFSKKMIKRKKTHKLWIKGKSNRQFTNIVNAQIEEQGIHIKHKSIEEDDEKIELLYLVQIPDDIDLKQLVENLHHIKGIHKVEVE